MAHLNAVPPTQPLDTAAGVPTVAEVMSRPVVTIESDATLGEARALFERHGIHHLLVMSQGRLAAVLSDRDVLRRLSPFLGTLSEQSRDARTLQARAFHIASYRPITIGPGATVLEAAALLLDHAISCLPVVEGERVVGIVTNRDLLRGLLACPLSTPTPDAERP